VTIPPWITISIAALVIIFGVYRLRLYMHGAEKYEKLRTRGPMYRIPRRTHLMMGVVFCGLGTWLILTALGVI
jgi:uncharacterized membrane protein YsdA (DUF1294 family)